MAKINQTNRQRQNVIGNGKQAVVGTGRTGILVAKDRPLALLSPGHRSMPSYPAPAIPDMPPAIRDADAAALRAGRPGSSVGLLDSTSLAALASQAVLTQRFAGLSMEPVLAATWPVERWQVTATATRTSATEPADRLPPCSAVGMPTLSQRGPR